jgi:Ferritin-like
MVTPITDVADLRRHLQWAIEVEHTTIPPYEYAMWSVVDPDSAAATSIKYVAREEMLHAALAANLLTAVGGSPRFTAGSVPRYPGPMPHHSPAELAVPRHRRREDAHRRRASDAHRPVLG